MKELTRQDKIINFCSEIQIVLRDDKYDVEKLDVIITINRICEEIIEVFNYDFNLLYNSITKLDDNNMFTGSVYKISECGSLKYDGYEKGYLFLTEGSSILEHIHTKEKEHYRCIYGDKKSISRNFCNIGISHEITSVNTDTIVRTYKYIPESMKG